MAGEHSPTLPEEITSLTVAHCQPSMMHASPTQTPAVIPPIPPPTAQTSSSNSGDSTHITALEGMVNQLAINMAMNMSELMALLRDRNRASLSFIPPLEHRPTVDPNPTVPPTLVSESEEVSFSAMIHIPVVYLVMDLLPPLPAPTAVPLLPAAFLSADSAVHAPPPVAMPVQPLVYTVLPPTIPTTMSAPAPAHTIELFPSQASQPYMGLSYQGPPPLNIPPLELGMPIQAALVAPLINFLSEIEIEPDMRLKKMEETIKALQVGSSHFDYDDHNLNLFPGMRLPPKIKIPDFKRYDGTRDPRHHLCHYQSLIEARKKLDMGVKLGRIDGPSRKKDGEGSKRQIAGTSKKGKDATVGAVNPGCQTPQPISMDYTPASPTSQAYAHFMHYKQAYPLAPPTVIHLPPLQQYTSAQAQQSRASASRPPQPAQWAPPPQAQQGSAAQPRQRKQVLLVPWITVGDFGDKIQEMINAKEISFNEVKPPHVHANPLPDHGSSLGPSINMISIAAIVEEEDERSTMGITLLGWVYQGPEPADKGKALAAVFLAIPEVELHPAKNVIEQEAEAFMKVIKASEYKVVEQMGKSPAHISLLALLLRSEPHRDALLKISFAEDELPSEGQGHLRALHIVCKCNNHVVGRVMIDNGSALNVCPVSTLKQMNMVMSSIHVSKTTVRAFDGSRREVNGEIDLLIDVGPCSFSVTFQILEIPNAFSLLLGRPWIHIASAVPSSLHQNLKFFVEGKLITVNGEKDYVIYQETAVPYIKIGEDQNLPFHSFDTISVIRDYR
ncbi:hypothetical protein CRG98_010648 [Punica granatum]|uniref:G-patch domain-containing protein n=1 Tax=Punica granatum TaxID=22663 RepID=A0A2I0KKD9_PUNGR|nr:hypothetical protein CRG98_010648 [Punica granatum]